MVKKTEKSSKKDKLEVAKASLDMMDVHLSENIDETLLKQLKIVAGWSLGLSQTSIAKTLELSDSYVSQTLKRYRSDRVFAAEISKYFDLEADRYKIQQKLNLAKLSGVVSDGLDKMKDNPELAMKHWSGMPRDLLRIGGVLADEAPGVQIINLGIMTSAMKAIDEGRSTGLDFIDENGIGREDYKRDAVIDVTPSESNE